MDTSLNQALIEQNAHWDATLYQHQLRRLHDERVIRHVCLREMQIITGIRRCGKSTLLKTIINHLIQKKIEPQSILYINFDDPSYTAICNDATRIRDMVVQAEKLTHHRIDYILFDEIQNVKHWEKYVKSTYDSERFKKIWVTGSNGSLLNSDYARLLSGRYTEEKLYPLRYCELLHHQGITNRVQLLKEKSRVLRVLDDMLEYGGFPRIHLAEDRSARRSLLKSYYDTIVLQDCIKNHDIRDIRTLSNLLYYVMNNITSRYSYNSLSRAVGSNENTVKNFVHFFKDAYCIEELQQFSYSLKSHQRTHKKAYCMDNGLVNAVTFKFSHNHGSLLEALVYSELKKRQVDNMFYFNDGRECDFIIFDEDKKYAMQVCYELNEKNRDRELKGLAYAMEKCNIPKGVIITYDQEEKISEHVQVIPFWAYFFDEI